YDSLGTFEFLIDATDVRDDSPFAFIEANPRLQVEHTVTEEITGVDLVQLQLRLAGGMPLGDLGLPASPPRGVAVQVRINAEPIGADGGVRPAGGTLTVFEAPSGPGIRVDTAGYAGYRINPRFDSLLAKLVAHVTSASTTTALAKAARALDEFVIAGVPTNIPFLRRL